MSPNLVLSWLVTRFVPVLAWSEKGPRRGGRGYLQAQEIGTQPSDVLAVCLSRRTAGFSGARRLAPGSGRIALFSVGIRVSGMRI